MKLGRILLIIIILSLFIPLMLVPQEIDKDLKITTVNVMINRVFTTSMGLIIEYYAGGKVRRAYLPNHFFENKTVVKIIENDYKLTPQMNVVFINNTASKIKLYIPENPDGYLYQVIDFMPQELIDKFKNTTKLEVEFKDENK